MPEGGFWHKKKMLHKRINNINKSKVLFVIPKNKSWFGNKGVTGFPHVGIAYLTAVLKKKKIPVKIFDEGIEEKSEKIMDLIDEFKPNIIGITSFSYGYGFLEDTIKRLKRYTNIPIIIGGPHIAATGDEIIRVTPADFALVGEGEIAFLEFLKQLSKKKPNFYRVPGLIWKKSREIVQNPRPQFIKDLDKLPFPDYEAFDLEKYPCFAEKLLPIITSRGCPYGCNYCSVRLSMGRGFRPRSPDNVLEELKHWYKKGFYSFDINDDCFTLDLKRAERICDLIIKNKLKIRFQMYNGIRVDRITPHLLKKLKKAGCYFISYGCESGNQDILNRIKKKITLVQVRKAIDWTNKAGIKNSVGFIIGHEGETYEQAKDTLKFAESLPTDFVNFYNLVPYPGTKVYEWAKKNAKFLFSPKTFLKEIGYRDNVPIFETKEFTKKQREELVDKGMILYERKILQFRLGKGLGFVIFGLMRIKALAKMIHWFAFGNRIGMKIYQRLSAGSKK